MGKDRKLSNEHSVTDLQRSTPSSRGSGGRIRTPLPQISTSKTNQDRKVNKGSNSLLSMQEVQRRAQLHEKKHLRSAAFDSNCELNFPQNDKDDTRDKKRMGYKRKKNEMLGVAETQEKLAEMSKLHQFPGSKYSSLSAIGQTLPSISRSSAKLPKTKPKRIVENNAVDIITRNEAMVRTGAKIKEISEEYMKLAAEDVAPQHSNNAPEVISKNEAKVGKAYKGMAYNEYARVYGRFPRSDDEV